MARVDVVMPKMGESIMEGTVIEWTKKVGDTVELDETLLEIATDKVDSEVPSPAAGVLVEIKAEPNETVEVGQVIAVIETDLGSVKVDAGSGKQEEVSSEPEAVSSEQKSEIKETDVPAHTTNDKQPTTNDGRFYSPLVLSIAKEEKISKSELDSIEGTGAQGRVSKNDVLSFLESRKSSGSAQPTPTSAPAQAPGLSRPSGSVQPTPTSVSGNDRNEINAGEIKVLRPSGNTEIIQMDRMRKIIAEHMVKSKQTSAHVTTFAEADVTKLVQYRESHKDKFAKENGYKLTFTPFFIEATIQALRDFPLINSSVDGDKIILKRDINYGIAVALGESGSGGLIVPVIKNAGDLNIGGVARAVNDLARKARNKQLSPDDLVGGTFTLTNYGSVGNLMGTPIINQPQVAIFGTGAIKKRPVVLETDAGDVIAIRHMVYLSMSYDHRIIDGALGGAFVQRVVELLEGFDPNRSI
jgi:2-oxoglutarate dehydrogenase E2 component (dihydrolipoamide succinyltransferase)